MPTVAAAQSDWKRNETFVTSAKRREQEEHRRAKTFREEMMEMLRKHGVECEPEYLWD
ncbi:MAG: hypothetical protein HN849_30500 [Victivallales bacterium]|nr:hypothetical protein [Victivallales bacterium]